MSKQKTKEYVMELHDEHEMLIEYSEMTTFDFNSEEFQKVKRDYMECKNFITDFGWKISKFFANFKLTRSY